MTEDRREGERRQVQRGGRRATDLRALTPELQAEAAGYAREIEGAVELLKAAIDDNDVVSARRAGKTIKHAADVLHLLLATGKSMRQS
jgi:hypothetical protein